MDPLGQAYATETLALDGGDIATLVSRQAEAVPARGAILYLHGFVDYFFQDHVASHFVQQGWAFYAVDVRRYGRSLRPGDDPWYTRDIIEYFEEIDRSIERIRADGHQRIILMGHSTGGLVNVLYLNDRREQHPADGLILNSPWLDLQGNTIDRTISTAIVRMMRRLKPTATIPQKLQGVYTQSIHREANGEWDFNTDWKPLTSQPVKFGFLGSIRREHARLHKGMDVGVPVLMLHSTVSRLDLKGWEEAALSADTVLDVEHMTRWLPKIGTQTEAVALDGALHDVMLSAPPVRQQALAAIDAWLERLFPARRSAASSPVHAEMTNQIFGETLSKLVRHTDKNRAPMDPDPQV